MLLVSRPQPLPPVLPASPDFPAKRQLYESLAATLGFESQDLLRAQLILFFQEQEMRLYDYAEVMKWLTAKRREARKDNWVWRPLRKADIIADFSWGRIHDEDADEDEQQWEDGCYDSDFCPPYDKIVPLHALEKTVKIQEKFGNKVKFFVSDFADPKADPFIMVRPAKQITGGKNADYYLIFDAWDEPGFGF